MVININKEKIKIIKWILNGGYSIADQAILSGGNFVLNIILARWLSINDYGNFALVFSFFLFFAGINNSLILEPISVIGQVKFREKLKYYITESYKINILLNFILSILLIIALFIFKRNININIKFLLSIFIFINNILLFWFMRRAAYVFLKPFFALLGSLLYTTLIISLLIFFKKYLDLNRVFLIYSISGFIASFFLFLILKLKINEIFILKINSIRNIINIHWSYSKWLLGTSIVYWVSNSIFLPIIGFYLNLKDAGGFRAIQNLILPLNQILTAISLFILPVASNILANRGNKTFKYIIKKVFIINLFITLIYLSFIYIFKLEIILLVYKKPIYTEYIWLLKYFIVNSILIVLIHTINLIFKIVEKPKFIFYSQISAATFTIIIGYLLITSYELKGVMLTMVGSSLAALVLLLIYTVKREWGHINV